MNDTHQKIIDAIIHKAETTCPDSLALIGLYGSVATGDIHEKSDLDLLILIHDDRGQQLADGFILDDVGTGYDMYCTRWEMLEEDAQCHHAHLSKLLDSQLIYIKDPNAVKRLEALREKATDLLASEVRYTRAQTSLENAKKIYADCFLTDSLPQIRTNAGAVIHFLLDAVMLHHGNYFRKGVKRTFEELKVLNLSFDMEEKVMDVIRAETVDAIRNQLTELIRTVQACLRVPNEKATPGPHNLSGTYEEIFSNWRNKMQEANDRKDLFSSFMNMVSFQFMLSEIAEDIEVTPLNVMEHFDPRRTEKNLDVFDSALRSYLEEYQKAGMQPKRFANVDAFLAQYFETE